MGRTTIKNFKKISIRKFMRRRMGMTAVPFFNLAKKSCKLGICRSERLNSQTEVTVKSGVCPPAPAAAVD